jgi:hypothetical protein
MAVDLVDGLDLRRVQCAAHELGHLIVWEQVPGARIGRVRVSGRGTHVNGYAEVSWTPQSKPDLVREQDHGYLLGMMAGREADLIWCELTGVRHDPSTCADDLAAVRKARRRHAPSRQWSERELATSARQLVRARWGRIERLLPKLARTGHL